ncbi:hypothetical protein D9757_014606 [Collybiopsis confluens]|uniref:Fatty acid desaturase domain-containing protein n=1 Tax=Collybiopsis confluens TaxID=2823264 RepID=A0A8H5FN78_9AGAR|nr:hypothetical protein D9757_014606 [Collybiopsis confluens]
MDAPARYDGFDTDIETPEIGFRRIKSTQRYFYFYRLQALYAPILYALYASSVRIEDLIFYFTKRRGPLTVNPFTLDQNIVFWGGKLFFFSTRILLPLSWGISMNSIIAAFFLTDFTFSIFLATIFQATHVVDSAAFPRVNPKTGNIDGDWAHIQVETAQDYAFMTFFSGSLNYQVIHHLFPTVAQEHIPALGPIVRQTAKEFGVKYEVIRKKKSGKSRKADVEAHNIKRNNTPDVPTITQVLSREIPRNKFTGFRLPELDNTTKGTTQKYPATTPTHPKAEQYVAVRNTDIFTSFIQLSNTLFFTRLAPLPNQDTSTSQHLFKFPIEFSPLRGICGIKEPDITRLDCDKYLNDTLIEYGFLFWHYDLRMYSPSKGYERVKTWTSR